MIQTAIAHSDEYENIVQTFFHSETIGKYSLENITRACEYFDNPQKSFKSVHVAGTNGKGSVSKMIFQMLKDAGTRVWVYTSPHNQDIRERFETDRGLISRENFITYAREIIAYGGGLSYFERCTLLAFLHFRDQGCEYAIIEVGIGGRLDASNILIPILSVITSISYDHMEFLGNTLEDIAFEKGGIIKPWVPALLYGPNLVLQSIACEKNAPVIFPEDRTLTTNLLWEHQVSNACIAYEAGQFLGMPDADIRKSLMRVEHHGRLEYIRPNVLVDGAHNEDGMKKLREYLIGNSGPWEEIVYSFNIKEGKSASLVLGIFPEVTDWNVIRSGNYCVSDSVKMADEIDNLWKKATIVTPAELLGMASENPSKLFVVFGSLYILSEFVWTSE